MFGYFSREKAHYDSGQIFPFLIAMLCVVLIMVMITVNLGQMGVFKTETSNAADAGALAAASVLSSTLLGLGLRSESMCGEATALLLVIAVELMFWWVYGLGLVAAIITYIVYLIKMLVEMQKALGEGRLGWTNAKKAAVQYAFSNINVEEQKPTFEEFLWRYCLKEDPSGKTDIEKQQRLRQIPLETLKLYHSYYFKGSGPGNADIRPYVQSGFSRFMSDAKGGYWNTGAHGEIKPGESSAVVVLSGYGWDDSGLNNYYDDCQNPDDVPGYTRNESKCLSGGQRYKSYKNYDNWVEAKVIGSSIYGLDSFSWIDEFFSCISNYLMSFISIPWFYDWMDNPKQWVMNIAVFWLVDNGLGFKYVFPMGVEMGDGTAEDYDSQVNHNYVTVKVTKHKSDKNLGVWKFRYGEIYSNAVSHAFQEHPGAPRDNYDAETIRPVALEAIFGICLDKLLGGHIPGFGKDSRHLFETELTNAF